MNLEGKSQRSGKHPLTEVCSCSRCTSARVGQQLIDRWIGREAVGCYTNRELTAETLQLLREYCRNRLTEEKVDLKDLEVEVAEHPLRPGLVSLTVVDNTISRLE